MAWRLEMWPIDRPKDYKGNPRKIPDKAVDKLAKIITKFGFRQPLVCDENDEILVGHAGRKGAKKAGLREIPVHIADNLSEAEKKAYRLADNRAGEETSWNDEALAIELGVLDEMGFDLDFTGFDSAELTKLLASSEDTERAEETPEPPVNPVSVLGDVWVLDRHRLTCGDSTDDGVIARLMAGNKAQFCFTSPPYNSAMTGGGRMGSNEGKGFYAEGYSDNRSSEEYIRFNLDIITSLASVADSDFTLCYNVSYNKNSPSEHIDVVASAKKMIPLVETIVWEKAMAVSLQGDNLTRIYEFVFVFCSGKFRINKNRTECLRNLWKISNIGANHDSHKACFPVALVEEGIKNFCPHGGKIIEPFSGTGTTIVAAERLGCQAFAVELDPKYCDVALERWQSLFGKQAIHEETGKTFEEMKDARFNPEQNSKDSYAVGIAALKEQSDKKKRKQA